MTNQKPKIFLSYVHEDIDMAKRIYQDLKRYGLDVWFDNESLLGGQNWKFEINKAIKESTYFLAVLSKESIDSIGYVQKELKIALEMLDLYPKNKTFILPVRIEDCEPIEERLSDLHWIDVFPENEYKNGINKVLKIVNPIEILLRSKSRKLERNDVENFVKKYGFFDKQINPKGKGLNHRYNFTKIPNDGIVIYDQETGLMWQQSGSSEEIIFEDVKKWIKKLNQKEFAGFNDWRLPTLEEAMSLLDPKGEDLYISSFFNSKQKWIWTADQVLGQLQMWAVDFLGGNCFCWSDFGDFLDSEDLFFVRAVRSGQ